MKRTIHCSTSCFRVPIMLLFIVVFCEMAKVTPKKGAVLLHVSSKMTFYVPAVY